MSVRNEALFLIGVYEDVLEEILTIHRYVPHQTMFLQLYKGH
jgi:hypothetical protein